MKNRNEALSADELKVKVEYWKSVTQADLNDYQQELDKMDEREQLYAGSRRLRAITPADLETKSEKDATHVWNIVAENIEATVDSNVPMPKVTAKRKEDEPLAAIIEDMLRNELDRMAFERMNDLDERTTRIQGGDFFHCEWDNANRTHRTVGELAVSVRHPKQVIPQSGVTDGVAGMDHIALRLPQTKGYILRKYGVDVSREGEEEPELRGSGGVSESGEMVDQWIVYFRNDDGGIGLISWVNDVGLEYLEDYQARRLRRCTTCGEPEPAAQEVADEQAAGEKPKAVCPQCGGTEFSEGAFDYETLLSDVQTAHGKIIPASDPVTGEPTQLPFYKPDLFPIFLRKNVSVFGRLLGESDADKIADQQNSLNRYWTKINERMMEAGTRISLPDRADFKMDPQDQRVFYIRPEDANCIGQYDFSGNLEYEFAAMNHIYEQSRYLIGVTDSYQGRTDTTATSGVAKEYSAQQAAGRMESNHIMKYAMYAELFEAMFKFRLAYTDEPRPVTAKNNDGSSKYEQFDRYDFLEQDENGEWYYNDQFLFSCDASSALANNRQSMWKEITTMFQAGTYGDPSSTETLILYWTMMEAQHYPTAGQTRQYLQEKLEREQAAMQRQAEAEAAQQAMQQSAQAVDEQARQDAASAAGVQA